MTLAFTDLHALFDRREAISLARQLGLYLQLARQLPVQIHLKTLQRRFAVACVGFERGNPLHELVSLLGHSFQSSGSCSVRGPPAFEFNQDLPNGRTLHIGTFPG